MEDRSNKTIICSILFLDIVEYSKKSVTGQISLKDRFNAYLSEAIHDVPVSDRIILDTGDGAAVNFLGDVESALTAALRLRESLLNEDPQAEPQLQVRIGINLGPVRLVRDINGQPNIVGDGINVAQRIMAFADASQILVSRSYYDAVSRLSSEYTGMFHYQGSRTDKHVREHEIYAIGYPGDQTSKSVAAVDNIEPAESEQTDSVVLPVADAGAGQAAAKKPLLYAAIGVVVLLAGILILKPSRHDEPAKQPVVETMLAASNVPSAPAAESAKPQQVPAVVDNSVQPEKTAADKHVQDKPVHQIQTKHEPAPSKKTVAAAKTSEHVAPSKSTESAPARASAEADAAEPAKDGYISFSCKDDTQVFVDGSAKGKTTSGQLTVSAKPGKHKVILTHSSFGIYTEEVQVESGKTGRVKPRVCN